MGSKHCQESVRWLATELRAESGSQNHRKITLATTFWTVMVNDNKLITWQFFVTFLGWLSDLQLGDEKVTLNHLVWICSRWIFPCISVKLTHFFVWRCHKGRPCCQGESVIKCHDHRLRDKRFLLLMDKILYQSIPSMSQQTCRFSRKKTKETIDFSQKKTKTIVEETCSLFSTETVIYRESF